ncbi:MAG: CotH kinase family protein [Planctomycetes bacterium]|nr:CotH kinase family protein [Planctomycetota bacterium]
MIKVISVGFLAALSLASPRELRPSGSPAAAGDASIDLYDPEQIREVVLGFDAVSWQALQKDPFTYVPGWISIDGRKVENVGIRYKGNSTFHGRQKKRSFKVDLDRFEKDKNFSGHTKLNLHHPFKDPSYLREVVAYQLFREAGVPAPRSVHVRLVLEVPGVHERAYQGVYTSTEQLGDRFLKERFQVEEGYALYKLEGLGDLGAGGPPGAAQRALEHKAGEKRASEVGQLLRALSPEADPGELKKVFDTETFLRWLAVNAILANWDSYAGTGHNAFLFYHPVEGRFVLLPWDVNEAFGLFTFGMNLEQMSSMSIFRPYVARKAIIDKVLELKENRERYLALAKEFASGLCSAEKLVARVRAMEKRLRPHVEADPDPEHPLRAFRASFAEDGGNGEPRNDPVLLSFLRQRLIAILKQLEKGKESDLLTAQEEPLPPRQRERRPPEALLGSAMEVSPEDVFLFSGGKLFRFDARTLKERAQLDLRKLMVEAELGVDKGLETGRGPRPEPGGPGIGPEPGGPGNGPGPGPRPGFPGGPGGFRPPRPGEGQVILRLGNEKVYLFTGSLLVAILAPPDGSLKEPSVVKVPR